MSRGAIRCLIALAFVLLFFAARFLFYTHPVIGEEGLFANLFYARPAAPNFLLLARVDGREYREPVQHPAAPYLAQEALGRIVGSWVRPESTPAALLIVVARWAFSLFQFAVALSLLCLLLRDPLRASWPSIALCFAAFVFPLAVFSSVLLHMANSAGAFMTALPALAVLARQRRLWPRADGLMFFLASVAVGLTRLDWDAAFVAASCAAIVYAWLQRPRDAAAVKYFALGLAGCLAGNVASYLVDPANYLAHVNLFLALGAGPRFPALDATGGSVLAAIAFRLWLTAPLIIFLLFAVVLFWKQRGPQALWLLVFPLLLALGYVSLYWSRGFEYRFFIPAYLAAAVGVFGLAPAIPSRRWKLACVLIALFAALQFAAFTHHALSRRTSITFGFGLPVAAYFPDTPATIARAKQDHCVPILPAWVKYEHPASNTDFIIPSVGMENAKRIAEKLGKPLCP